MLNAYLFCLGLLFAVASYGGEPKIDNERVAVWDSTTALPPAAHDFVAVPLAPSGPPVFGRKGAIPGKPGVRTIVIELKEASPPPITNSSGYPLAFPRPRAKELLENQRVIIWDYEWYPGEPTPLHFHDKDALAVYESTGVLQSTTPDGNRTTLQVELGKVTFNRRDRSHTEVLVSGSARAIIIELK